MSITDELKEYAEGCYGGSRTRLKKIAERIDAAHEKELAKQFKSLTVDMEPMTDENMAKGGWVRLPKDADGEYIHIGDEVDTEHFGTVEVEGFVHSSVAFYNYSEQPAYLCMTPASLCRRHHEPTIEDMLEEYRIKYYDLVTDMQCMHITNDEYARGIKSLNADYAERIMEAVHDEEEA